VAYLEVLVVVGGGGAPECPGAPGLGDTAVVPGPVGQEGELTRSPGRVTIYSMDNWRERERERERECN